MVLTAPQSDRSRGRRCTLLFAAAALVGSTSPAWAQTGDDASGPNDILTTLGELVLDGGYLMIPIGIASIWMIAVSLERVWSLRRGRIVPRSLWGQVREKLQAGSVTDARHEVSDGRTPVSRMLHSGLLRWDDPFDDLSRALEEAGQREADDLQKHLPALQGIASVAPLLGLLGTVVGMIQAFFTVAKDSAALGNAELLAEGIGQALVTTAAGLSVAIPALVLFYAFRGRTRKLVRELDDIARGVLEIKREAAV